MTDLPSASPARPGPGPRWLPTIMVAAVVATVVLGGIGLDAVVAAPSAGTVSIGGVVPMTAAPGWVLATSPGASGGIELQKSDAVLTAQLVASLYPGVSASMLSGQEKSLSDGTSQISYGDAHHATIEGHDTTYVVFEATVASGAQSGVVDGELVCMVVDSNAVVIVVVAPQGDLDPVIDDISAMLASVGVAR